mmetsp:Transcript_516/g.1772  ORF Transcript_516/g.1772 Transcript_516/m.1772 type:complete len:294 (+) Transcript_516:2465-3346(+)
MPTRAQPAPAVATARHTTTWPDFAPTATREESLHATHSAARRLARRMFFEAHTAVPVAKSVCESGCFLFRGAGNRGVWDAAGFTTNSASESKTRGKPSSSESDDSAIAFVGAFPPRVVARFVPQSVVSFVSAVTFTSSLACLKHTFFSSDFVSSVCFASAPPCLPCFPIFKIFKNADSNVLLKQALSSPTTCFPLAYVVSMPKPYRAAMNASATRSANLEIAKFCVFFAKTSNACATNSREGGAVAKTASVASATAASKPSVPEGAVVSTNLKTVCLFATATLAAAHAAIAFS